MASDDRAGDRERVLAASRELIETARDLVRRAADLVASTGSIVDGPAGEIARLFGVIDRADDVLRQIAESCPSGRAAAAFFGCYEAAVAGLLSAIGEARRILDGADPEDVEAPDLR